MVTENIMKGEKDEFALLERDIREARSQLDQATSSGNLNETLQSMVSYIQNNDFDDPFLGPVSDDDHSRWIVTYAPTTTPGVEIEGTAIDGTSVERNGTNVCCAII